MAGEAPGQKPKLGKPDSAAVLKSGNYTKVAIEDKARSVRVLAGLEDAMRVLNMTTMPRSRGRKPLGYTQLQRVEDVVKFMLDNPLHLPRASDEYQE